MSFDLKPVNISRAEEIDLLKIVRATERAVVADPETGKPIVRYYPTAEQERAMERIVASYENAVTHAALRAKRLSREDAAQVARMTVMRLAYESKVENDRIAGAVVREMRNEIIKADGREAAMSVPYERLRLYLNLVEKHGSVTAAFDAVKAGGEEIGVYTFIAVNRAINADSVEAIRVVGEEGEDYSAFLPVDGERPLTPEEIVVADDLVRSLFDLVTDEQGLVLRLSYGFQDRVSAFVRTSSYLGDNVNPSDREVADALALAADALARSNSEGLFPTIKPLSRPTVNRRRMDGLSIMREGFEATMRDEEVR